MNLLNSVFSILIFGYTFFLPSANAADRKDLHYQCSSYVDIIGSPGFRKQTDGDIFVADDGSSRSLGLVPISEGSEDAKAVVYSYALSNGSKKLFLRLGKEGKNAVIKIARAGEIQVSVVLYDHIPSGVRYELTCDLK